MPDQPAVDDTAPPPIPTPPGSGLAHVVVPGGVIWLILFAVLLFFVPTLREHHHMQWLWTALAGWVLGIIGMSIYAWQRWAARHGRRTASRAALEETIRAR